MAISSRAEVGVLGEVEDRVDYYREKGFDFVPIPSDDLYFCVEDEEYRELIDDQVLDLNSDVFDVVGCLSEYPFALVNDEDVDGEDVHYIITVADLNKRCVKEAVYPLIVDLENKLSDLIVMRYPDPGSEELVARLANHTVGHWFKSKYEGVELHIAQYMSLSEMVTVIQDDNELVSRCGFSSKTQFRKHFSGLVDLRNKIMHPNRTLFHSREDVDRFLGRLNRVREFLDKNSCSFGLD